MLVLGLAVFVDAADVWTWSVAPCTGAAARSGCLGGDEELARWAFAAWQRESGDRIIFEKAADPAHARLRIFWTTEDSFYGETRPIMVDGKRGAEIYILPDADRKDGDSLLRDAVVYLTFVHETGHALGLEHTAAFADIMYSFQYGGDINEYFGRYRRLLKTRADIALHSGLSDGDRSALKAITK